jgi:DNA-binding GntR family transcriptional regulator
VAVSNLLSGVAPLDRSSLRDQARRALRTGIITGEIAPGTVYAVGTFAEKLGVSATPIREALADLANLRLVRVIRNRGFIVTEMTEDDLDEIFELRMMLEVPAVERVAGRLSADLIEACRAEVERGSEAAAIGDLVTFLDADRAFHLRILAALGNDRLVEIVDRLRDQTRLYGLRELAVSGALTASAEEHRELLAAIEAGNKKASARNMALHLKHTRGAWAGRAEGGDSL